MATTSISRHHAEWLNLVDHAGPFLSLPVLARVFPQGLDTLPADTRARLRQAYEEWRSADLRASPALHHAWFNFVLREALGIKADDLAQGQALPANLTVSQGAAPHRPTAALLPDPAALPVLILDLVPPGDLVDDRTSTSPTERMRALLRATGARLGLITNGEAWTLVAVPRDASELPSFATFAADLWFEEPLVLRAFVSLLQLRRLIGVAPADTLPALFVESARDQHEITDQLGRQVRAAVEVLIQTIDRIDRDRQRTLLTDVDELRLYRGAVTLMMRLVFLFTAEERNLLPRQSDLYNRHYAASTLRDQLETLASRHGEELLERRYAAWCRLLALTRAIHGGIAHHDLHLPAYGSSLFDPDAYPFLEGRARATDPPAAPLPIDDRTVLRLLRALQLLQVRLPGGGVETRRLSFRGLGVEDIGHIYEGLLDHTAVRARSPILGLQGPKDSQTELPLEDLEARAADPKALVDYLESTTGRARKTLERALAAPYAATFDDRRFLLQACDNDADLVARIERYTPLLRKDPQAPDLPVVFPARALYVTQGAERRTTGTHYTPPELTSELVRHTLDPLCYEGPATGEPRANWRLRPAKDLLALKICDMAMGSGAFLVQACRTLGDLLCQSWAAVEAEHPGEIITTPEGALSGGKPEESLVPTSHEERQIYARRLVADRCLYGVDKNPMAVEMAKLALWLETFHRNKPFSFLNHALHAGDSLLGLTSITHPFGAIDFLPLFQESFTKVGQEALRRATPLRQQLSALAADTTADIEHKAALDQQARLELTEAHALADAITHCLLTASRIDGGRELAPNASDPATAILTSPSAEQKLTLLLSELSRVTSPGAPAAERSAFFHHLLPRLADRTRTQGPDGAPRTPFHWPLAFPEVFDPHKGPPGFDALIGNPPFQGGQKITGALGTDYRDYLVHWIANHQRGSADLCAYFFLRAADLLREGGAAGLVATNTIAQGDTREVGLEQILAPDKKNLEIFRAISSQPWPGEANLEVSHIWLYKQKQPHGARYGGPRTLDGATVPAITAALTRPGNVLGKPHRLKANEGKSFQGSNVLGKGFVLTPEEAAALIAKDPRNKDVLFPYLNGEDLNSTIDQSPTRWVIFFRNWPLNRDTAPDDYEGPVAADYSEILEIVRTKVKPERDELSEGDATARDRARRWWQFARPTIVLYESILSLSRVATRARIANIHSIAQVPTTMVFNEKTVVFPVADAAVFALLQSNIHESWAREFSSTLRSDMQYTPSDCFETFPFPSAISSLEALGTQYETHRRELMQAGQRGLTKTYNRFHDPQDQDPGIVELRRLHVELDHAVAAAYGWRDLDLGHGFHQTKQGRRYTLSETARRELLDRLLALNHQRYAEEVAAGLHDKHPKKNPRPTSSPAATAPSAETTTASGKPGKPGKVPGKPGKQPGKAGKIPDNAPDNPGNPPAGTNLELFTPSPSPTAPAAPAPTTAAAPPDSFDFEAACAAVLAALAAAPGPLTSDQILQAAALPDALWPKLREHLVKTTAQVLTEGKARGTRYRLP
jgi:hypothetical protein